MNELTKIAAARLAHPTPEFQAALHDLLELDLECVSPSLRTSPVFESRSRHLRAAQVSSLSRFRFRRTAMAGREDACREAARCG